MAARVVAAVEERLVIVLATAEVAWTSNPSDGARSSGHSTSFAGRRRWEGEWEMRCAWWS